MPRPSRWIALIVLLGLGLSHGAAARANEDIEAIWTALRGGGHVIVMRHAHAPGTGDPPDFRLDDCSTQRNLSAEGREQARRIGQRLRDRGVKVTEVLSSRWCRCLETAELLGFGPPRPFPALDSFFQDSARGPAQTAEVKRFVSERNEGPVRVLITHQVNITALTEIVPRPGEMVVLRPLGNGEFKILGVIPG